MRSPNSACISNNCCTARVESHDWAFVYVLYTYISLTCLCLQPCVWCRHISLFEELELLKEFEKRETTYTNRYTTKKQEKREMETKVCTLYQFV